jgi:hypothetical protein
MADLTQDELTVLLIAAEGESIMPIGRWQGPVEALVAKGYLHANDRFNNVITDAGRKVCGKAEDDNVRALVDVNNALVVGRQKASDRAEELAILLAELAAFSASITGDDKVKALREWAKVILERAMELVE